MRSVVIVGGTVAVGLALIALWALLSQPPSAERGPITYIEASDEASGFIDLGEVRIAVAENFIGNRIFIVGGSVTNVSPAAIAIHRTGADLPRPRGDADP